MGKDKRTYNNIIAAQDRLRKYLDKTLTLLSDQVLSERPKPYKDKDFDYFFDSAVGHGNISFSTLTKEDAKKIYQKDNLTLFEENRLYIEKSISNTLSKIEKFPEDLSIPYPEQELAIADYIKETFYSGNNPIRSMTQQVQVPEDKLMSLELLKIKSSPEYNENEGKYESKFEKYVRLFSTSIRKKLYKTIIRPLAKLGVIKSKTFEKEKELKSKPKKSIKHWNEVSEFSEKLKESARNIAKEGIKGAEANDGKKIPTLKKPGIQR